MEQHVFGVAEVNQLVKQLLDGEPMLQNIYVRGELSNYKMYPSGHHYFTLKDADGALRCVMFRGQASRLRFRPENGMQAIARGRCLPALLPRPDPGGGGRLGSCLRAAQGQAPRRRAF